MRREVLLALLTVLPAWADSQTCAGCHRKIYEAWAANPMARSWRPPSEAGPRQPVIIPSAVAGRYYQVLGNEQSEHQPGVFQVSYPIAYVVGSGNNGHSYVVRRGGELFQAPLSWFAKAKTWGLSPGYERQDQGFHRPILPVCVTCHAGSQEQGIGCADCHGDGANHQVVNPARLPVRLADQICMRCHQDGDARILQPGKRDGDFRPGRPLSETVAIFKIPGAGASDLLEHHYALSRSRCFTASGGKLGCLSCHDPHGGRPDYRAKCLGCHAETACTLPRERRGAADDCVACHMPKREERQISHAALTLHRIVRRADQPEPPATPNLPGLIYLNGAPADLPRVTLLEAYAQLAGRGAVYQQHYLELLEQARQSDPRHPFVLAAVGRKALREKDPKAVEYLTQAVAAGAISPVPYQDLAEAWARAGRPEEAARVLREGIARFPYAAVLQKLLASRYIDLHDDPAARRTIARYLELFPDDAFMREMLRKFDAAYSNRSISPR